MRLSSGRWLSGVVGLLFACTPGLGQALPSVSGRTLTLSTDSRHKLFVPDNLVIDSGMVDVLVHFHGDPATVNNNAGYAGLNAVIVNVSYSGFSSAYSTPFSDPTLFGDVLDSALVSLRSLPEFGTNASWDDVSVSSFSAGYGAVREILKQPAYFAQIDGLLLADSLYASFTSSTNTTPSASQMAPFVAFAQAAAAGTKTMVVSHSQVQTYTYANTAETADALIQAVGTRAIGTNQTGLGSLSFYRTASKRNFEVWGATGASATAHTEHLRFMAEWLDDLPFDVAPDASGITLADFESGEGVFNYSPLYSGSNLGIATASADRVTDQAHGGVGSQRLEVVQEAGAEGWFLRHVAGGATPVNNVAFASEGWIGVWVKTQTQGLTVRIGLDDPDSADLSLAQRVVPDGAWHLYQWDLDDPALWEAWAFGDGEIDGPTSTLDALFFEGTSDAEFYIDDLYVGDAFVAPGLPGDADLDQIVSLTDLSALASHFGMYGGWAEGNFNGDSVIDLVDLSILAAQFGVDGPVVPEPASVLVVMLGAALARRVS
ncbi:MAG: hypothetical protein RLN76_12185 [Phycisphaeraceae bacterium]